MSDLAAIASMSWPELDALIGAYSPDPKPPISIAVSGGGDSTALLHRASDWARKSGRELLVLTVDHGLRAEAGSEAEAVAAWASDLGHAHQTLKWNAPRKGQAQARKARHTLLAEAARGAGSDVLMLGHNFDDVVETILMRHRRKAPRDQLAAPAQVSPSPIWPEGRGLTLIRPMLGERRASLRVWLNERGHDWFDDPSNKNRDFERVRVRQFLQRQTKLGGVMDKIAEQLIGVRAKADQCLGEALLNPEIVRTDAAGLIQFVPGDLPPDLAIRVAGILLRIAGGHDRTPRAGQVRDLLTELQEVGRRQTLAKAWVQKTKLGYAIGRAPGPNGDKVHSDLWDGRYERGGEADRVGPTSILLRASQPPGVEWRPVIADRICHEAKAYQTLRAMPAHR